MRPAAILLMAVCLTAATDLAAKDVPPPAAQDEGRRARDEALRKELLRRSEQEREARVVLWEPKPRFAPGLFFFELSSLVETHHIRWCFTL